MIFARTYHQVGTGLCELHYFNAVAPNNSSSRSSTNISTKAWPPVNSVSGIIDDTAGRSRTTISRLCDSCIDVLRFGSVSIDGYDVATANDKTDRVACLYSDICGYHYVIDTHTSSRVAN